MSYIYATILLIIIVLLLIYSQQLLEFVNLIYLKFKTKLPSITKLDKIDRDILIELAKIEKILYKKRFTRKAIIKDSSSIKKSNIVCYRFYYYQFIDGVHAYIDIRQKGSNEIEFNIYFETHYDSKKISISTNRELFILNSKPDYILLFKKENLALKELYNSHLKDRVISNETIFKKRLSETDLIRQVINREHTQLHKLEKNGYIKHTKYGFKLLPTFKLFKNAQECSQMIGLNNRNKTPLIIVTMILAIAVTLFLFFTNINDYKNNNITSKPIEKSELQKFKERVQSYKGLSNITPNQTKYTLANSMKDLDDYLQNSKIKRFIGKPLNGNIEQLYLPCKIPNDLKTIYRWHNGIELLVPNRDLFRYKDMQTIYSNYKDKSTTGNNFVIIVASKNAYRGLAYNCKNSGIYEYAPNTKTVPHKEFYNIKHFLKITSQAYKQKAFYDDFDTIKIDLKKFFKIYREYLSSKDKHRYKSLVNYLNKKSYEYQNATKELKLQLLEEIAKTYDSNLTKATQLYLKDSDSKVVSKAILTLGDIGNKSSLPSLINFLHSKTQQYRDFALLSIAKIVNSKDKSLLNYIYPMLDDKSILVRLSAYKVIEKIASKNSLIIIREHFNKAKPAIKLAIIKIFAKIGGDKEFKLLKSYLNDVNKMNFSTKIKDLARGDAPHPKILHYEIVRALAEISSRINSN